MTVSTMPSGTKQDTEIHGIPRVESLIWTDRRQYWRWLTASQEGLRQQPFAIGRKVVEFEADKVYAPATEQEK
ncbi:MAG: hypothetical protein ACRERU_05785 [Methylococcales bacterium]